jgi:FkbH-like protein
MMFRGVGEMNILVMRNITTEPMNKFYKNCGYDCGMQINIKTGDYDNIIQEAIGSRSDLFEDDLDCVLIFARLEGISPKLANSLQTVDSKTVDTEIDVVKEYIERSLMGVREKTDAMIIWHGFESNPYPRGGIAEICGTNGLNDVIYKLNLYAKEVISGLRGTYYLDTNVCMTRVGSENYFDYRLWHIARCPYSVKGMKEIIMEGFKYIRASRGLNKKCIVLDCDNTLWGGVIGEDGLGGIKIGRKYPGSEYYEFQQEILNLHDRGIMIALCSKNNEDDVMEVFRSHPDMLLREEHIAAKRINWADKVSNIRELAYELNIGLDSMVFVDDSDFERGMIRAELKMVDVLDMPNRAVHYKQILASCGLFDTLVISDEDKTRGKMYREEAVRKEIFSLSSNISNYLESLDLSAEVRDADDFSISRISQLTQKTNQFNLTTKRYSEEDIGRFVSSNKHDVIYLKLKDRVGDSGITGVCILHYSNDEAVIDSFLMSCRIIGRGAEDVLLRAAMERANKRGIKVIKGVYIPTKKNMQVSKFYSERFFSEYENQCSDNGYTYKWNSGSKLVENPKYFKDIVIK